jgi:HK97 gp10 family phage protein
MAKGMDMKGDKALAKTLKRLGVRVQRRVMRQAVNAATTPIVKAARSRAPKRSGLLKKSLGKKVRTYAEKMTVVGIVGPRTNVVGEHEGKKVRPALYSHLVERGFIAADGSFVPPQPFLEPAMAEAEGQAVDIMREKLAAGVVKEAQKGAA